ncbi:MAG: hypothetical protein JSW39_16560 [Desulfobacterales bacterium]|nr:MAG: hypothetical protein JSW39_16560 [Desulfobacterales bacterium]
MANNFEILKQLGVDGLQLDLRGDFNGTSALELVDMLKENHHLGRVIVNTDGLKNIYPFGAEVFQNNPSSASTARGAISS